MTSTNVIVPSEVNELIAEREQIWSRLDQAQGLVKDFRALCSNLPNVSPASLNLSDSSSNPPSQIQSTMNQIKQELAEVEKLNGEIRSCHEQIESIKRNEKLLIGLLVVGVVLVLGFFIVVVAVLVSSLS